MSFCSVPASARVSAPCRLATATYSASRMIAVGGARRREGAAAVGGAPEAGGHDIDQVRVVRRGVHVAVVEGPVQQRGLGAHLLPGRAAVVGAIETAAG